METLLERKKRIIAAIEKDDSLLDKLEQFLNQKSKVQEVKREDETWKKYVEPIGEKTDIHDIMENDFLGDIPEEEIFREIDKMS